MTFSKRIKSTAVALAAGVVLSLLSMVGVTGTANAASTAFKLCNYGSGYSAAAVFPWRGDMSTYAVAPGECVEIAAVTDEPFYVSYETWTGYRFSSTLDRTYPSGRTLVQTWADASYAVYGKLPY
ncbi:hypothetical protein [Saccharothrix sp. Mg75]|uniref:hypothetical protein n=1 Tax=Saccharothrix sp. Mg75 TaxID=3445357 RepID=UPI003EE872B9